MARRKQHIKRELKRQVQILRRRCSKASMSKAAFGITCARQVLLRYPRGVVSLPLGAALDAIAETTP